MKTILAIDLGTTYSVCACLNEEGEPEVIENSEGERLTPSVVLIEDDHVSVGDVAKDKSITQSQDVIATVKNYMGQKHMFRVSSGKEYSPEVISGYIIRKIVSDAGKRLKREIDEVIITVPAYFSDAQRMATAQSAQLAGVKLAKPLLNEPTAAAIYFAHKKKLKNANIMVYDLGGGTFDVTVLTIHDGEVGVRATCGISRAGGHFFDQEIVNFVCEKIEEQGIDLEEEEYLDELQELYIKAEKCKIQLSSKQQTDIAMKVGKMRFHITVTRDFLEQKLRSFYMRSESKMKEALRNAGMQLNEIDEVLLIGGSSKIPFFSEQIEKFSGKIPSSEMPQDEAVALGAALYSKIDHFSDVCSHSIGIVTVDDKMKKMINSILIKKNTKIPITVKQRFFTYGNSSEIPVQITEGEFAEIQNVTIIGDFMVELPQGLPRGTAVDILINLDENQIIHVFVNIESIHLQKEFHFDRPQNISEDELHKLKGLVMQTQIV